MRLALISDQHFDASSRWEEMLRIAGWIAGDIAQREVDLVVLGGDLFERRPVPLETKAAAQWLISLAETSPVVGVYGNHDVPESLAVMNRLEARHPITIYDRPAVHYAAGAAIACLPWPRKAHLLAAVGANADADAVAHGALQTVLLGLGDELERFEGPRLFVGHVMMRGSKVSTGQPLAPGADFEIGLEDLALARAYFYGLGHIHMGPGNEWKVGDAPAVFPGSPRRTSYGETEPKGYVIAEVDEHGPIGWERIETPCTPMCLLEYHWDGEGFWGSDVPAALVEPGAEVRYRYSVASEHRESAKAAALQLRDDLIRDCGVASVKIEERVTATKRARAPELAQAATLPDKLQALWRSRNDVPDDERAARLIGKVHTLEEQNV